MLKLKITCDIYISKGVLLLPLYFFKRDETTGKQQLHSNAYMFVGPLWVMVCVCCHDIYARSSEYWLIPSCDMDIVVGCTKFVFSIY